MKKIKQLQTTREPVTPRLARYLWSLLLLLTALIGGTNSAWAEELQTTPIGEGYTFVAQTAMNGKPVSSSSSLGDYIKCVSSSNYGYADNKGSSTINGTPYNNCMQIKEDRGLVFSVAQPCKIRIYGQANSSRFFTLGTTAGEGDIASCATTGGVYEINITSEHTNKNIYLNSNKGNDNNSDLYLAGIEFKFPVNITFNANGGSGDMAAQEVNSGEATALNTNTFTPAISNSFVGWNTAADGIGTDYTDGADITTNEDIILYAQWMRFNSLGGENPKTVNVGSSQNHTLYFTSTKNLGLSNSNFSATSANNEIATVAVTGSYNSNRQLISVTGVKAGVVDITTRLTGVSGTLYDNAQAIVHFTVNATINYNTNGGDAITADVKSATYDLPTPTKTGYTFGGWYSDEGLTQAVASPYTPTVNTTLYAKWSENPKSTVEDLATINTDFKFTPSAGFTDKTLYEGDKLLSLGGSKYSSGLQFKENRAIAFKVAPNAVIKVTARNGSSVARDIQLGTSTSNYTNLQTLSVASGATSTLTYQYAAGGLVYLTSNSELYLTELEILFSNGYSVTYVYNGHGQQADYVVSDVFALPTPLPTPTAADGYTFVGWYNDNVTFTSAPAAGENLSANKTLYAKWMINKGNNVKLDGNGITTTLTELVQPQTGMAIALPSAYETAENVNIPGDATWNVANGSENAGPKYGNYYEAYYGNNSVTSVPTGNVLTQSISVANGKYEVILDVAASATNIRNNYGCPIGQNLTQAFAGTAAQYIPVIDRTELDPEADYDRVVLVTEVTNGTLTYGIKNVNASGNWYICRVHSIKKIDDSNFNGWYDAKTGGNKIGDAGQNYTPASNNITLYAQWTKKYTFRPVASNGTISSVTVNGNAQSMENNHDYKINENSTIVMTVAPANGYKFKNWVVSGTAGTEDGMTYTISAINADTKLTAKFEALSDATDPNPANGELNAETSTVAINPFPATSGNTQQDIDLGLPTGATFTVTNGNAIVVDGKLRITAPTAPGNASYTINVVAENGTTNKSYTINVSTVEGQSFSYTVNAVDGSDNVLGTLSEGIYAQGTGELKLYHPKYVKSGNKLYGINANKANDNPGWFVTKFTPQSEGDVINVAYANETVENVVFYSEGEDCLLPRVSNATTLIRAASGAIGRGTTSYQTITTLPAGTYKFVAAAQNGNQDAFTYKVAVDGVEVLTHDVAKGNEDNFNGILKVSKTSEISINSTAGSAGGIDWIYIQDLGVLPVTVDGQEEYLIKTNCDANSYITYTTGSSGTWDSKEFEKVSGNYLKLTSGGSITLKSNGALAYEVFVNADANKKYKINNSEYTTAAKGTESRMFECSNNNDVTINIAYNGNSVYPVKVKFYTKPLIVGAETTILMGKGAQSTDLNVVGGTAAQLVTPSAQASAIVSDVRIVDGKLYATPVKAGVANLTINIVDGESHVLNTVDYVVNVVKQQVTMTYLADGKDSYHVSDGAFTSPTVLIKDADDNNITTTVNDVTPIIYISDDETLVKYNSSKEAELLPNVQGVAKLKAVLYNNPVYEDALATFIVNVSAGIDKKLYTMGTDSKGNPIKVGNAEPAINSTLVAEQGGKVLMTMTYGGYKYQNKLIEEGNAGYNNGRATVQDSWKGKDNAFTAYNGQGKDIYGHALDNQIDDFGFQVQAQQDSRDEYNKGIQWFTTDDVKPNGTHYTAYERIKPFSLPVKGAYLKFEAEVNGILTAYVLQNGNITFSDDPAHTDEPAADPLGANPRVYYWFNQDGYRIDPTSFSSKQPLTIGRDYNAELAKQIQEWIDRQDLPELKKYLITDNAWPVQAEVNANLKKPVPTPQTVVRYQEGYMVAQKAYVKYVIPVVAGDTYYFFSNASKVGAAGFNFLPAEDGSVELILPEEGGTRATIPGRTIEDNDGKKTLDCQTDVATTHKTDASIDMYKEVTLPRKFKVNTWSTICLPFHVTETQVERVFGTGTNLLIYNGISEDGKARFQKHVNQDILAGQPYLIYPTGVDADANDLANVYEISGAKWIGGKNTSITFTNVNFTPNIAVQSYASDKDGTTGADGYGTLTPSFNFIGTLAQAGVNQYDYYVNNNTGALTRYTGTNQITLNAYYAYLKQHSGQNARVITGIAIDDVEEISTDVPTGIMDVLVDMGVEVRPVDGVFNLSGQKVADSTKNLPAGIYIVNGQKVSIK